VLPFVTDATRCLFYEEPVVAERFPPACQYGIEDIAVLDTERRVGEAWLPVPVNSLAVPPGRPADALL